VVEFHRAVPQSQVRRYEANAISKSAKARGTDHVLLRRMILAQLERAHARTAAELWASDAYWDRTRRIRDNLSEELRHQRRLQSLSKRYGKKKVKQKQFLQKVSQLNLPSHAGEGEMTATPAASRIPRTRAQLSTLLRLTEKNPEVVTHPYFFRRVDIQQVLEISKPLTWSPPGRHRLKLLDKAEELLGSDKYRGRMHSVAKELERLARRGELDVPRDHPILRYSGPWADKPKLTPYEQRDLRHRLHSGVGRRKAAPGT
jgi:hypothetical protein